MLQSGRMAFRWSVCPLYPGHLSVRATRAIAKTRFVGPMAPSMRILALLPAGGVGIALSAVLPGSLYAQAGSTGGNVGKTEKSVSGTTDDLTQPDRKKGSRSAPVPAPHRIQSGVVVTSATYGGNCGASRGNVTSNLAQACNGKRSCHYVTDRRITPATRTCRWLSSPAMSGMRRPWPPFMAD